MKTNKALLGGVVVGAILAANSAIAANCADRYALTERLKDRYNETAIAYASGKRNQVMEVFASPGKRSWSILVTFPDRNLTCLAASGKGTRNLEATLRSM